MCFKITNAGSDIFLSNFKLSAKEKISFENYDDFFLQDESLKTNAENALVIIPKPFGDLLTYQKRIKGKRTFNIYFFLILSVVYFLTLYKIMLYLAKFKIKNNDSRIDIVFLSLFFLFIFLPMSNISTEKKSGTENRNLASFPSLRDLYISNDYALKFEAWFNDHFYLRKNLVQIYEFISDPFFKKGNTRVLIGKDNWLFYKGDNGERNFENLDLLSEAELVAIKNYLTDIQAWAKKHGKGFYYMICPDKSKIYGEYYQFHKKTYPDSKSRAHQLISYLKENTTINIIYPYESLLNEKSAGYPLYWKNDTHWNPMGAYIGYQDLMKALQKNYKVKSFAYKELEQRTNPKGDLTAMFSRSKKDHKTQYFLPKIEDTANCEGEQKKILCANDKALNKYRIVVFRDSYSIALIPYLNATFSKARYNWRYDIKRSDLEYIKNQADIIILEQVERLVPWLADLTFPKD